MLARVASSSSTDLFRAKLWFVLLLMIQIGRGVFLFDMCFSFAFNGSFLLFCSCKLFYEVSDADNIYQQVSLDKFEIVPWQKNDKVSRFLKKCRESKNPEALYRKGVVSIGPIKLSSLNILPFHLKLVMNNLVMYSITPGQRYDKLGCFGT